MKHAQYIATLIAHLPGTWTAKAVWPDQNDCTNWHLKREDGFTLFLKIGDARDKTYCGYSKPNHPRYGHFEVYENSQRLSLPSIHFSPGKTEFQAAADITRRLIPDAEHMHKLCTDYMAALDRSYNAQDETLKAVCEAAGVPCDERNRKRNGFAMYPGNQSGYADVNVNGGGSTDFKISSLPKDRAVRLAALLKEFFTPATS